MLEPSLPQSIPEVGSMRGSRGTAAPAPCVSAMTSLGQRTKPFTQHEVPLSPTGCCLGSLVTSVPPASKTHMHMVVFLSADIKLTCFFPTLWPSSYCECYCLHYWCHPFLRAFQSPLCAGGRTDEPDAEAGSKASAVKGTAWTGTVRVLLAQQPFEHSC